jgi:hypothetical protein
MQSKAKQKIKKIVTHHKKSLEIPKRYGDTPLDKEKKNKVK